MKKFSSAGAVILGISPDTQEAQKKFEEKHGLAVTLLSDPERTTLKSYGAFGEKKMYGKTVEGVIRSTFLIDPEGKIRKIWSPVKVTGHAEVVLGALKEIS